MLFDAPDDDGTDNGARAASGGRTGHVRRAAAYIGK
jgi:hypothetical protein